MPKNIIFDLDGTLIDSRENIRRAYAEVCGALGIPPVKYDALTSFIGPPMETVMSELVGPADVEKTVALFREKQRETDVRETNKLYPGIKDLLAELKRAGKNLFVATSKGEPYAEKILSILDVAEYFTAIKGATANCFKKADVLENLIKSNGLRKEDCILIGDTVYDVKGAQNVGIAFGAVGYGFGKREDFAGFETEFFAGTAGDLREILTKDAEKER